MTNIFQETALIHVDQVVIRNTENAGVSSGGLIIQGGSSTKDIYTVGHVAINNVKITPNLNDYVYELQATLTPDTNIFTNITDFVFDNSIANTFKTQINVTVSAGTPLYALYELYGVYKNTGWILSSTFMGDRTGVSWGVTTSEGIGTIQYKNSNPTGSTTIIRYRALTTAPAGTAPTGSTGIINNTTGPYIQDTLLYANSINTIASATDITLSGSVFKVGGTQRVSIENASTFTNFSNGGSLTVMGDMSVAKKLYVNNIDIPEGITTGSMLGNITTGNLNVEGLFRIRNELYITYPLSPTYINLTTYKTITNFTYEGSDRTGLINNINITTSKLSSQSFTYSLRLIDFDNRLIIGEVTSGNNIDFSKISLGTLSNIPSNNTNLELQAKLNSPNEFGIVITGFEFIY